MPGVRLEDILMDDSLPFDHMKVEEIAHCLACLSENITSLHLHITEPYLSLGKAIRELQRFTSLENLRVSTTRANPKLQRCAYTHLLPMLTNGGLKTLKSLDLSNMTVAAEFWDGLRFSPPDIRHVKLVVTESVFRIHSGLKFLTLETLDLKLEPNNDLEEISQILEYHSTSLTSLSLETTRSGFARNRLCKALEQLSHLKTLHILFRRAQDALVNTLFHLSQLTSLKLDSCSEVLSEALCSSASSLKTLHIAQHAEAPQMAQPFPDMPALTRLNLTCSQECMGSLFGTFSASTALTSLKVHVFGQVPFPSDNLFGLLSKTTQLQHLKLQGLKMTQLEVDELGKQLSCCTELESLTLAFQLDEFDVSGLFSALPRLTMLSKLSLMYTWLEVAQFDLLFDEIPPNLQLLYLPGNLANDTVYSSMCKHKNQLQHLFMLEVGPVSTQPDAAIVLQVVLELPSLIGFKMNDDGWGFEGELTCEASQEMARRRKARRTLADWALPPHFDKLFQLPFIGMSLPSDSP